MKQNQCVYCEREFKYISEKKRHELSHRTEFECKICLKKFNFLSALRRHEKQHQRTETVLCKECNGSFRDESLLKRHINYAHKGTFTCVKCLSTFSSTVALKTHMKIHKSKEERKYKCNYENCNKSFNFSHHLKHHVLTHTDSKQFFCNVCGKGFIQSHHLKRHLIAHEPESWLSCTIPGCKKKFATDYARKRHHDTHKNMIPDDPALSGRSESKMHLTSIENPLVCTACGEFVTKQKLASHAVKCLKSEPISPSESPVDLSKQTTDSIEELRDVNENIVTQNTFDKNKSTEPLHNTASNCNNAIGGCIVTDGRGVSEGCLCAQIPISQEVYESDLNLIIPNELKNESLNNINSSKGCVCSGYEENNIDTEQMTLCPIEIPNIEYRHDGTIKITDTFDIYTQSSKNDHLDNSEEIKPNFVESMPLSCQAILGNCIVSGDGTIGDGCLCARMSRSSQQATAQEIDEITICTRDC